MAITFGLVQSGTAYANPSEVTLTVTAGNKLTVHATERSGTAASNFTISDGTGATWTQRVARDVEHGSGTYRRTLVVWERTVTATDDGSITVSVDNGTANSIRTVVAEWEADAAVTWTFEEAASNDNGQTTNATSIATGTTASVGAGDLLLIGSLYDKHDPAGDNVSLTGWATVSLTNVISVQGGSNGMGHYTGFVQDTASGTKASTGTIDPAVNVGLMGSMIVFSASEGGDTDPPTFETAPAAENITADSVDITATINENGTIYAVVVDNGDTAPSSAQVVAGQNSAGSSALDSGSIAATASTEATISSLGNGILSVGTDYDVYVVAEDDESGSPNVQASPTLVEFTTARTGTGTFIQDLAVTQTASGSVAIAPTITDFGDEDHVAGDSVNIDGGNFEAAQGTGRVVVSPTDDINDSSAVEQTVTAWSDAQITITVVRDNLTPDTTMYLFVENDSDDSNIAGYQFQFGYNVQLTLDLETKNGNSVALEDNIVLLVWYDAPSANSPININPDESYTLVDTDSSGQVVQSLSSNITFDSDIWVMLVDADGGGANWSATAAKITPTYI